MSICITLWNHNAEYFSKLLKTSEKSVILSLQKVKVTSYYTKSLSTSNQTYFLINPQNETASSLIAYKSSKASTSGALDISLSQKSGECKIYHIIYIIILFYYPTLIFITFT